MVQQASKNKKKTETEIAHREVRFSIYISFFSSVVVVQVTT